MDSLKNNILVTFIVVFCVLQSTYIVEGKIMLYVICTIFYTIFCLIIDVCKKKIYFTTTIK